MRQNASDFYFSDSLMSFNHDFRVFIFGAEVTVHVRGSLSMHRTGRDSPGTANFDLDGVGGIFTILAENKGYIKDSKGNFVQNSTSSATDVTGSLSSNAKKKISELSEEESTLSARIKDIESRLSTAQEKVTTYQSSVDGYEALISDYAKLNAQEKKNQASEISETKAKLATAKTNLSDATGEYASLSNYLKDENKKLKVVNSRLCGFTVTNGKYEVVGNFNNSTSTESSLSSVKTLSGGKVVSEQIVKTFTSKDLYSDDVFSDAVKKLVYINKSVLNANVSFGNSSSKNSSGLKPYSLSIDSCIFEKHDPVRVFIKDPCSPFSVDKWVPYFTGFIQNISDHVDYTTGEVYYTVSCYDIRGLMQHMRVMINPRISRGTDTAYDSAQNTLGVNAGMFADYFAQGGLGGEKGSKYKFSSFDEAILDMITGRINCDPQFGDRILGSLYSSQSNDIVNGSKYDLEKVNSNLAAGKSATCTPSKQGMGCFMPGLRMECPDFVDEREKHIHYMELWYDLLVFGTKCTYFTSDEVTKVGIQTIPWGEFDPFNGFLHILLPKEGSGAANLFSSQLEDLNPSFEFINRFELVTKACEIIDYQWFCNGMGDIVVEFPMYDFLPESFGAYEDQLCLNNHLISTSVNEITEDVVTAMSVTGGITRSETAPQGVVAFAYTAFAKSDLLAYKYGINVEEYTVPTMRMDSSQTKLQKQAVIELIKRNVNATSMEMEVAYRYAIYPNKPVLQVDRGRIAVVSSFEYNMQINESVTCGMDTRYVRKKQEDNQFIHIFNGTSMPIKYLKGNEVDVDLSEDSDTGIDVFGIKYKG